MIRLHHGDARSLPISDGSVDLCLTDPPYGLSQEQPLEGRTYPGSGGFGSKDDHTYQTLAAKWDLFSDYDTFTAKWLAEAHRVLRPGGSIMICISSHHDHHIKLMLEELGMKRVSVITVCKRNAPPSITRRQPTPSTEFILWYSKGKGWTYNRDEAKDIGEGKQLRDFWLMNILSGKESRGYRSQKPIEWMERCVRLASHPKEVVLDPFAGTSTTLVAAAQLGREAIGFESNEAAIKISEERFKEAKLRYKVARSPQNP